MMCDQFPLLPNKMKLQIIQKCRPIAYVCLRQTCRFVDQFCELHRKHLEIYIEGMLGLFRDSVKILLNGRKEYIIIIRGNISHIRKSLSGFAISKVSLGNYYRHSLDDEVFNGFLEATPELQIGTLQLRGLTAEQVRRVMESSWKIAGIDVADSPGEMPKILEIDELFLRKMDSISLFFKEKDADMDERRLVRLARGKQNVSLRYLPNSSTRGVLKEIIENWKKDSHFPQRFDISWKDDDNSFNDDISELYTKSLEAVHLGTFSPLSRMIIKKYDIWIREDKTGMWQLITTKRFPYHTRVKFVFETLKSKADFDSKLATRIEKVYPILYSSSVDKIPSDLPFMIDTFETVEAADEIKQMFCKLVELRKEEVSVYCLGQR